MVLMLTTLPLQNLTVTKVLDSNTRMVALYRETVFVCVWLMTKVACL